LGTPGKGAAKMRMNGHGEGGVGKKTSRGLKKKGESGGGVQLKRKGVTNGGHLSTRES